MSEKKTVNTKLSDALDVNFETKEEETNLTTPEKKQKRLAPSPETTVQDYNLVRNNLKDLISTGEDAIEGIIKVAMEGDSPRVAETNKDLIELHKKMKDINKEEINVNNTTNNSIYVGSTRELQDLINQARSTRKELTHDIIDVEVEENDK